MQYTALPGISGAAEESKTTGSSSSRSRSRSGGRKLGRREEEENEMRPVRCSFTGGQTGLGSCYTPLLSDEPLILPK